MSDVVDENALMEKFREKMRKARAAGIEEAAAVEARWDGRDFTGLSRADKQRYIDRFTAAMDAYSQHVLGGVNG